MRTISEVFHEPPRAALVPDLILRQAAALAESQACAGFAARAARLGAVRAGVVEALGLERIPRSTAGPVPRGRLERDGYAVEKLVFETVPGLPVPAHLYLPAGDGPRPAVVHAPGHWMENAKVEPDLQRLNIRLARSGIAVLCYDTLGQGERRRGWHQHGQLAPMLVGFTSLGVMVAESLTALDLLERRPDIDGTRLGMTGTSGGGFSTIFAAAVDERIIAAAAACIVNTHLGQIRDKAFGTGWGGWVDLCNQVPGLAALAPMADVIACAAPRDVAVIHAREDSAFPLSGAREVQEDVRALYEALDARARFQYVEVEGEHGLHRATRDAVASFLAAALTSSGAAPDVDALLLPAPWKVTLDVARAERPQERAEAPATESACLDAPVDSNQPLVDAARVCAAGLRLERPPVTAKALEAALGPWPDRAGLQPRVSSHVPLESGHAQRVSYEVEEAVCLDAVFILPDEWSDSLPAVFVGLDEGGKEQAFASAEALHASERGCALFLPDLRGTGETAAPEFEVATAAWMLDRDLLSQRVWDVVRTIDYLSERSFAGQQFDKGRIVVWGTEAFGLVALIAAALDTRIAAAGSTGLASLEELLVECPRITPMVYRYRLLELLDVDDLVRLAAPRAFVSASAADGPEAVDAALRHVSSVRSERLTSPRSRSSRARPPAEDSWPAQGPENYS